MLLNSRRNKSYQQFCEIFSRLHSNDLDTISALDTLALPVTHFSTARSFAQFASIVALRQFVNQMGLDMTEISCLFGGALFGAVAMLAAIVITGGP